MPKQTIRKFYTVLLTEEGFPIIHQCLTCSKPIKFAPRSYQSPIEACMEFEKTVECLNPVLDKKVRYEYVTSLEYFFILGIDLLLGDI